MREFPCSLRLPKSMSRRDILRASLVSAGFMAFGSLAGKPSVALGAPRTNLKRLIVINMVGGCDTLNMVVPVALPEYYTARGSIAIPAASALTLSGTPYKLHPSMPKIAALWNSGDAAAVQRVGYPNADLSHFTSMDIFSLGIRDNYAGLGKSGWIARFADFQEGTQLSAVAIGVGRPLDLVGGINHGLAVSSLASFDIAAPAAQIPRLQATKDIIHNAVTSGLTYEAKGALSDAYDLAGEIQTALTGHNTYLATAGITWPKTPIANNLKDVAALIQGGFDTRIFYTGLGGFDTHAVQLTYHTSLFSQIDAAMGAFSDEMKLLGVWDDIVVVVITEFGRRTYKNGSLGTDHGHGFAELLMGGAVKGGQSYGPDLTASDLTNGNGYLAYGVDFRSVYKEIIRDHMGGDPQIVFPETQELNADLNLV